MSLNGGGEKKKKGIRKHGSCKTRVGVPKEDRLGGNVVGDEEEEEQEEGR